MPNETDRPRPVPSPGALVVKNGSNRRAALLGRDARSVVHDRRPGRAGAPSLAVRGRGADPERAAARRLRMAWMALRVRLTRTCWSWPRSTRPAAVGRDVDVDLDPARAEAVGLQAEDAVDEGADRGRVALRRPLPREVEQVLDDPPGPVRLLDQQVGLVAQVLGQPGSGRMSWLNATIEASGLLSSWATPDDELADRLHLLGLDELRLEPLRSVRSRTIARTRASPSICSGWRSISFGNVDPSSRRPVPRWFTIPCRRNSWLRVSMLRRPPRRGRRRDDRRGRRRTAAARPGWRR